MKIRFNQGYNDIGVVVASKLRHILHVAVFLGTGNSSFFPLIAASMSVKLKRNP